MRLRQASPIDDDAPLSPDDILPRPPEWMRRARCAEPDCSDLDPFELGDAAALVEVCDRCPVRAACGAFADEHQIRDGVWGGRWRGPTKKKRAA